MKRIFIASLLAVHLSACSAGNKAKLTIKVVDDDGRPLMNMPVKVLFNQFDVKSIVNGESNINGLFTASGVSPYNDLRVIINKDGYYKSSYTYKFTPMRNDLGGKWQPWNPVVTTVVRRIVNPIPMYAKTIETKIPKTNEWFGYDFKKADWVRPEGKGIVSDLVFRIDGFWNNYRENDSTLTLSFSNPKDGIIPFDYPVVNKMPQGSEFILPREASLDNYQNVNKWRRARTKINGSNQDNTIDDLKDGRGYVFRIRSVTNEEGKVISAYYGAMPCKIDFVGANKDPKEGSWLRFTYYLNPTVNDRNLEFDLKKNLFKNWSLPEP